MVRFRATVHQSGYWGNRIATCALAVVAFFAPSLIQGQSTQGQSEAPAGSASLQGSVRDSGGHALAAATVHLQVDNTRKTLTAQTNSEGIYRFSALGEGVYTLRAEMAGYGEAIFGPCVIGRKEAKRIDLTLVSKVQSGSPGASGTEKPQFFDEPTFTVAGVTEAMNPGGHGSDTILRTTEALAKETASLGTSAGSKESSSSRTVSTSSLSNYENAYDLALAHAAAGEYQRARTDVRTLLARQDESSQDQATLHNLLGEVEEKLGNPLESVREYQRAAELDPNETNLFDWAAELLTHRASEPAIEVFTRGNRLFPGSVRMLAGLAVAWYARGSYDQAAQRLCQASDLFPSDPNPYLLMGKMQAVDTIQSECIGERLGRFAELEPDSAIANYNYALSLFRKWRAAAEDAANLARVESLLEKAVRLDPKLGPAYLQLGILYSERGDSPKAIAAYQKATKANPGLEEAHFRLAQAYNRSGEKSKAQAELQLYDQLSKQEAEQVERERHEIQQFVYTLRDQSTAQPR
jgi:tetratricopeptide (TPR) repeat protein